jgi:tRNA nucleotidyltransferase/poly(A) polymerase
MFRKFILGFCLLASAGISANLYASNSTNNTNASPQTGNIKLVDGIIAVVNGEPILLSDVRLYQLLFGIKDFHKALDQLIDIYVVAQYAKSKGIEIPPQKLERILEHFAKTQHISVEKLYEELNKMGLGGSVFKNFLEKYNLYVAAIQIFVLKPLHENKDMLNLLLEQKSKTEPVYEIEIVKIPKKVAEKNMNILITKDINKISETLKVSPVKIEASLKELKPHLAEVVKRLKPGKVDFAEDEKYLYVVKLDKVKYEIPNKEELIKQIEQEKIKEFVKQLREQSNITILIEEKEPSK